MDDQAWLAERFEEQRPRLWAVAYRMLGSLSEADDAVQDAWLRVSRAATDDVENLAGWLTTIVARVSLNMLRSRREVSLGPSVPEPIVDPADASNPEHQAELADSVGLALLVVLETLSPPERLAFVLHDLFAMPFDEIAPIVDRSPEATRQLASRARRGRAAPGQRSRRGAQWEVVEAFLAAAREGDFDALVAVLDPNVVLRADAGASGTSRQVHGARAVASQALTRRRADLTVKRALVNGAAGMVSIRDGQPFSVAGVTVRGGKIVEIDILADPDRLRRLDLAVLDDETCASPHGWATSQRPPEPSANERQAGWVMDKGGGAVSGRGIASPT